MSQFNFQVFKSLDSSNCEAKRMVKKGEPSNWILALAQTQGRGRRGKYWYSAPKNFMASFFSYPNIKEKNLYGLSYVAGIAFYDAVSELGINSEDICLKWPNDLLLKGKKVGGILLESISTGDENKRAVIIGFGLNLVSSPSIKNLENGALPTDHLKNNLQVVPTPEEFLKILMPIYAHWSNVLMLEGFNKIRDGFLKRTIPIGNNIQVKSIEKFTVGKFFGISHDGALIVDCSTELMFITAGDVVLIGK